MFKVETMVTNTTFNMKTRSKFRTRKLEMFVTLRGTSEKIAMAICSNTPTVCFPCGYVLPMTMPKNVECSQGHLARSMIRNPKKEIQNKE